MKIVISGGTGFIGRPLADRLTDAGHRVVVLSRRAQEAWRSDLEVRQATAATSIPEDVRAEMEAFVHLASEPLAGRWTRARMERIRESRSEGTGHFMREARLAPKLRVVINASGVGLYGPLPEGAAPVREDAAVGDGFLAEVTAAREEMAEKARAPDRRVVHLRIGLALHPSGGYLGQLAQMARKGFSGQVGKGAQGVSWIHRDDLLRLIEHGLGHPTLDGPVNACAPGMTTNRELVLAVAATTGRRGRRMPGWLARLMLGPLGSALLTGQHVEPARALESGFHFDHPDLTGALAHLYASGPIRAPNPSGQVVAERLGA